MDPKNTRKVYAPYSTTGEQVGQTPLQGYVDVAQAIYPAVNTGQISTDGEWSGVITSDKQFIGITTHSAIPNTGVTLSPDTPDFPSINMKGYKDIFIAIKPTNGGNYATNAVAGPDTTPFANLIPVNSGTDLRGCVRRNDFDSILIDSADSLTADVWNIFIIQDQLKDQENFQFKVVNGSGGNSDIEVAFMRLV